ncbi:SRPBCC family protein [Streptomyces sp. 142MFCol3.1]|uniref:SRPBCC family protein n=1 Tax=Streptomyces sp. 142MFCol3.1 TaxID=1172179 RepID=UPI00048E87BA|nr:SRPBCC domain-containing protein [Streptomyces sp. 142MFCol3.1]
MEHEVFVPVPPERLREALTDPARVARAVPGLQQDAGTPPVSGRLKVRVGGHTITYRGRLAVTPQDNGSYAVEGDGSEVRGGGSVKLALTARLLPADGGTTLAFGGTATGDGRVAELPADAVSSAGTRLLSRFAEGLAAGLAPTAAAEPEPEQSTGPAAGPEAVTDAPPAAANGPVGGPEPGSATAPDATPEPTPEPESGHASDAAASGSTPDSAPDSPTASGSVFEAEVPPPSLDPLADDDLMEGEFAGEEFGVEDDGEDALDGEDAMAEAAHARRTMIGRSAEEVDHAPPRGRYAPVPPPEATAARATLRWAAPAAALALASAIALTRALRKRR